MTRPLRTIVTVPPKAKLGQLITIRALVQHPMENGFRHNEYGQRIERDGRQSGWRNPSCRRGRRPGSGPTPDCDH